MKSPRELAKLLILNGSGGGSRTPDTRIMIRAETGQVIEEKEEGELLFDLCCGCVT
jgi:hypothetical protein